MIVSEVRRARAAKKQLIFFAEMIVAEIEERMNEVRLLVREHNKRKLAAFIDPDKLEPNLHKVMFSYEGYHFVVYFYMKNGSMIEYEKLTSSKTWWRHENAGLMFERIANSNRFKKGTLEYNVFCTDLWQKLEQRAKEMDEELENLFACF